MPGELVESGGDTAEVLEFAEDALDQVSLAIYAAIDGSVDDPLDGRGDVRLGAGGADQLERGISVVTAVGDDLLAFEACRQLWDGAEIVSLAGGEPQTDWQACQRLFSGKLQLGPMPIIP